MIQKGLKNYFFIIGNSPENERKSVERNLQGTDFFGY